MVHKRATADHYYLLKKKGKTAVKTSQQVTKIMRPSPKRQRAPPGSSGDSEGTSKRSRNAIEPPSGRHKLTLESITQQLPRFGIEAHKENAGINYFILSF